MAADDPSKAAARSMLRPHALPSRVPFSELTELSLATAVSHDVARQRDSWRAQCDAAEHELELLEASTERTVAQLEQPVEAALLLLGQLTALLARVEAQDETALSTDVRVLASALERERARAATLARELEAERTAHADTRDRLGRFEAAALHGQLGAVGSAGAHVRTWRRPRLDRAEMHARAAAAFARAVTRRALQHWSRAHMRQTVIRHSALAGEYTQLRLAMLSWASYLSWRRGEGTVVPRLVARTAISARRR